MPELKKEQIEVINHEEGNILVSASAGSGKTFVMINRLIRLIVEQKTSVKNVLCVTFTEAAASEMKAKLKDAITKKIAEGANLADELLSVKTADICTIHAFCARLIRKYFFIAKLAPDFKIADENKAEFLITESVNETFSNLYKNKDNDFLSLLKRHGKYRSDKAFKELVTKTYKFLQTDADPDGYVLKVVSLFSDIDKACEKYKEYLLITLKNLLSYCDELICRAKALEFENAEKIVCGLAQDIKTVVDGDIYTAKRFEGYKLSLVFGRNLGEEKVILREEIKKLHSIVQSTFKRVNDHVTDRISDERKGREIRDHLEKLFKIVGEFGRVYSAKKREENVLDFADLEHFALEILRNEQVLSAVRENYRYVFADEYQDVNGVQEEILSCVSKDNLFMVGDVKQSIYGFRGCRPEIFEEKEKRMKEAGEKTVRLNHNFRSANGILDAVNDIFSYSMTEALYGTSYKKTAKLIAGGIYPETAKGQTFLYLLNKQEKKKEKSTSTFYDLVAEAKKSVDDYPSNTAQLIEKIIREELGKKYYDTKSGEEKNVTFSDIVILNKNRDNEYVFGLVSDLLRLNIPVASEVSENVLAYPEIQLLVSVLRLIDCKAEDIPLVAVMKSPIGNFTEGELLQIALLYKDYQKALAETGEKVRRSFYLAYKYALENMGDKLGEKLKKFDKYVDEIRLQADFFGAGKILEEVIFHSGLENHLIAKGNAEEKFKRISFFLKKATEEKIYTVHEFLSVIDKMPKNFLISPSVGHDAVRVMTIHASKGLEFPVVIVCGLEKGVNRRPQTEEVLKDYQLGLCLKNYDDKNKTLEENLYRGLFKEKMRVDKIKEDLRLFYVATTRASYSMHLTFEASGDIRRNFFIGADKFVDYLPKDMEIITVMPEELTAKAEEKKGKRTILVGKSSSELTKKIEENLSFNYPFEECTTLPIKMSVTRANVSIQDEESVPLVVIDEGDLETGAERGVVAHKILENLDFETVAERGNFLFQVKEMVSSKALTAEEVSLVNLDRLEGAVIGFADRVKGKTLYREQPFLANIDAKNVIGRSGDKILVQGVIDLLATSEEGAEIIDYKYSVLAGESLKRKYAKQLELYALAVESVLGVSVKRKTLVNVLSGELVDF